ncbi:DUF1501 domain-containing protein [Pinibacter soli]|uniref:DUF1501 domain-containing protein n=1 Tax=Pinibacter soli TaxID=3044211 RepID=A0ABT6R814_9BACT|nr:DUF1501 domain-containing protein [Pinibacter soli]MDI3318716.1 DUF1501 domain-containing protein [Pinibacter soli]
MKRRTFFKYTVPSIVAPVFLGGFNLRAFAASPLVQAFNNSSTDGNVLVLIQLAGGNDGLNMVIPVDYYSQYINARKNIAIEESKILRLTGNDSTGLHPSMTGIQNLYNDGQISLVQGVSYPAPNFSHFKATDIWLTGEDSSDNITTGWLGRYLEQQYPGYPDHYPNPQMPDPFAIQIGSVVSPALQGHSYPMGMAISNPESFYKMLEDHQDKNDDHFNSDRVANQLSYLRELSEKTDAYAGVIKKAAKKSKTLSTKYEDKGKNNLSEQLKIVARLISGGLQTKVYVVNIGGFDTHAGQTVNTDTSKGKHAQLLENLSNSIAAFMDDLKLMGVDDRVMGMTFSEFGRRIRSNASGGTDHGVAAPVIVFGKKVKGGQIGHSPIIPDNVTVNDNVAMQYDFRSLYASILKDWLGVDQNALSSILLHNFDTLPLIA